MYLTKANSYYFFKSKIEPIFKILKISGLTENSIASFEGRKTGWIILEGKEGHLVPGFQGAHMKIL